MHVCFDAGCCAMRLLKGNDMLADMLFLSMKRVHNQGVAHL